MKNGEFSARIVEQTVKNSRFEEKRNYISLSQIYLPVEDLVKQFKEGYEADQNALLKCYKGYQMEDDLLRRIKAAYGNRITFHPEITHKKNPELFKGHPDFKIDEYPGDCKSIPRDEYMPDLRGPIPKRIYWQMQAYMLCMNVSKCVVVFESRESGKIIDQWINANANIQNLIELKLVELDKILK